MRQVNEALYTNKYGEFYHPDIPSEFDSDSLREWSKANGVELRECWKEDDCNDDIFDEIGNIRKWKPVASDGFILIAKFHNKSGFGPYAYFGKKVGGDTCQS